MIEMMMRTMVLMMMLMLMWSGVVMKGESDEDGVMMSLTNVMVATIIAKLMKMKIGRMFIVGM